MAGFEVTRDTIFLLGMVSHSRGSILDYLDIYSGVDGAGVSGSTVTLGHRAEALEGEDSYDMLLGAGPPGMGSGPVLGVYTSPWAEPLRIDYRPADSLTPFEVLLQTFGGSVNGVDNWLELQYMIGPSEYRPEGRLDVSIWGTGDPSTPYFTQTVYASQASQTDSWSLTDIPDGHVYGKATWTPMAEVIPEPSTLLLLIGAGGALAWRKLMNPRSGRRK